MDLLKDNQGQNVVSCEVNTRGEEDPILCEHHQKPCVMFCLEMECWELLCPKCPLGQHQEHNLVSLAECVKDSDELKQMKQTVYDELVLLQKYESNVRESKSIASKECDEAVKAINKKANELKSAIDRKADEMRRNIERSSAVQVRKLDGVLQNTQGKSSAGSDLKIDIENRPRNSNPQAIQHVSKLKQRLVDFQKSSNEVRNKILDYGITRFKPIQSQFSGPNLLGELVTSKNVIQKGEVSEFESRAHAIRQYVVSSTVSAAGSFASSARAPAAQLPSSNDPVPYPIEIRNNIADDSDSDDSLSELYFSYHN